jgi:transcriptional regulator with XRE-family HTH domain
MGPHVITEQAMNTHISTFDANLRAARAKINLNQVQLARMIGTAQTNLSKWERGISTPNINSLLLLAEALHTTASDLLAGCSLPPKTTENPTKAA